MNTNEEGSIDGAIAIDMTGNSSTPLLQSILDGRDRRYEGLNRSGRVIRESVKSNASWMTTIFVLEERALNQFYTPWAISTANAIIWTVFIEVLFPEDLNFQSGPWTSFYSVVLTTCLAFLLVFRLNRAAVRWWNTRQMWGVIVEQTRVLVSEMLVHMIHAPGYRDQAICWTAGFLIAVKQYTRGEKGVISEDELAGFLTENDVMALREADHPGLFATTIIRHMIKRAFRVTADTPVALSVTYNSEMRLLESSVNSLISQMGGLERVKNTPLPIVYVAHLRSFLLFYLISLPYVYGHTWGWGTIPVVILTSFALLGIDGAASECERPFERDRPNHLDMEWFCLSAMKDIEHLVRHSAELHVKFDKQSEDHPREEQPFITDGK